MKKKLGVLLCVATIMLSWCSKENIDDVTERQTKEVQTRETDTSEEESTEVDEIEGKIYIGEYLDYDYEEPSLEIEKEDDGEYIIQITIAHLATFYDGIGELTEDGMYFTATDPAGNPISGIITVEDEIATVTFTDSTWELIENGSVYKYTKSSNIPHIL